MAVHENSEIGNAIALKTLQGSFSVGEMHSLSGMTYSLAVIISWSGRMILIIENIPRETAKNLLSSSSSYKRLPLSVPATVSGMSCAQQQQQQHSETFSKIFTSSTMGSTVSTTVL